LPQKRIAGPNSGKKFLGGKNFYLKAFLSNKGNNGKPSNPRPWKLIKKEARSYPNMVVIDPNSHPSFHPPW